MALAPTQFDDGKESRACFRLGQEGDQARECQLVKGNLLAFGRNTC